MTSVRVPGFSPAVSGFHFANSFPKRPLREFNLAGIATLSIGDAANGLCGGMSYSVGDLFNARLAPPADTSPPAGGTAAFEYIVNRQIDSFDDGHVALRFYELMAPLRPDREPGGLAGLLGRAGLDDHSRTYVMVHEEWPRIRADLDSGALSMLGLVRVVADDPKLLGRNHQVVAYGYDLDGSDLTLLIYDPNWPDASDITLRLDVGDPTASVTPAYSRPDGPVFCFFRTPYAPRGAEAWKPS